MARKSRALASVAIVGLFPPPIGGVSIHIKRLQRELNDVGVDCIVYDLGADRCKAEGVIAVSNTRLWLMKSLFSRNRSCIVHYHGGSWLYLAVLAIIFKIRSQRLVCTLHSLRENWEDVNSITKIAIRTAAVLVDRFVVVAPHIRAKLLRWKVSSDKILVIPAFIPPRVNQLDFAAIPPYIWEFVERHSPIITANAFKISFYQDEDLYGIDLCIGLCADLKRSFPDIGFVFCLPEIGDTRYFEDLKLSLLTHELDSSFLFVTEPVEYYPILANADLFVRPTNTDGDAVSVREALALHTPVVCSDVVERPNGVILFRSRDPADLLEKSKQVLTQTNPREYRTADPSSAAMPGLRDTGNIDAILEVYRGLL